jgi:hypothetical protein
MNRAQCWAAYRTWKFNTCVIHCEEYDNTDDLVDFLGWCRQENFAEASYEVLFDIWCRRRRGGLRFVENEEVFMFEKWCESDAVLSQYLNKCLQFCKLQENLLNFRPRIDEWYVPVEEKECWIQPSDFNYFNSPSQLPEADEDYSPSKLSEEAGENYFYSPSQLSEEADENYFYSPSQLSEEADENYFYSPSQLSEEADENYFYSPSQLSEEADEDFFYYFNSPSQLSEEADDNSLMVLKNAQFDSPVGLWLSPPFENDKEPLQIICDLLRNASKTVDMVIYRLSHPQILQALESCVARGVCVGIVVDSGQSREPNLQRACDLLSSLKARGAHVKYQKAHRGGLVHHKILIIDNRWAVVGSANATRNAFEKNDESIVVLDDTSSLAKLKDRFQWYKNH